MKTRTTYGIGPALVEVYVRGRWVPARLDDSRGWVPVEPVELLKETIAANTAAPPVTGKDE